MSMLLNENVLLQYAPEAEAAQQRLAKKMHTGPDRHGVTPLEHSRATAAVSAMRVLYTNTLGAQFCEACLHSVCPAGGGFRGIAFKLRCRPPTLTPY